MKTVIKLQGGHSTVVQMSVSEVAHAVEDALEAGDRFLWLQSRQHGDNGCALDPSAVVALFK